MELQGWKEYHAGLDTSRTSSLPFLFLSSTLLLLLFILLENTTGKYSVFERFGAANIMYHVATYLPKTDESQQVQLLPPTLSSYLLLLSLLISSYRIFTFHLTMWLILYA